MGNQIPNLTDRLEFAVAVAAQAGELIVKHYQKIDLSVELKGDQSPVTIADREAERLIRSEIDTHFPEDGIVGEEFGETVGKNRFRWFLDPIDGTKSFVHGVPLFGTLIGLEWNGQLVLGVCRFPALNEVVYAAHGLGAWWEPPGHPKRPARVSTTAELSEATFCTTTVAGWQRVGRQDAFDALCGQTKLTRGWGDCYGHMLVATGRADVMVDPLLNPWDAAALVPIVQEAGGAFLDFKGECSIHTGDGFSVNANLKSAVLEILAD